MASTGLAIADNQYNVTTDPTKTSLRPSDEPMTEKRGEREEAGICADSRDSKGISELPLIQVPSAVLKVVQRSP